MIHWFDVSKLQDSEDSVSITHSGEKMILLTVFVKMDIVTLIVTFQLTKPPIISSLCAKHTILTVL